MMPGMENIGLRWRQVRFNPLRSLTPERLASALDSHAAGWLREAALIFETIEQREAIVRSVMTKRKSAVARRDWQVIVADPDAPNAEAHKATLEYFYNNLTVTDATDLNVRTGMSGLIRQMMDSIIQRYAVHEIVWQPGPGGLTAELRRVPLYFFENRSGRLRFTGPENRADGMPLEEDGWMITVADGLGEALSICWMFKRLGIQDLLAFSEKFSVPGVMGRTSAKKDSPEGIAMRDSVLAYASEWVGLVYGDDGQIKDPISVIQTPGSASLPPMQIAEYFDRMIATLVRGGDLSTISRDNGNGSNPQQDETDTLLEDDCAMVSETLQTQLDRLVIRMVHGDETPAAYVVINPPSNQDLTTDLSIDEGLARLGVKQDPADLAERYGREVAEESPSDQSAVISEEAEKMTAENESPNSSPSTQDSQLSSLRTALTSDLQPLGAALASAMQAGDLPAMQAALRKISKDMPELAGDAEAMTEELAQQFTQAFTTDEP
jgi:phage gp29-like protein